MTVQKIIEELLRARIYRTGVRIRTEAGQAREVIVRDVHYDGSRSAVVVSTADSPRERFTIPLEKIKRIESASDPLPSRNAVA